MSYNQALHRVYQAVRQTSPQTQPDLVESSGLSLPAVIQAIKRLEQQKLVLKYNLTYNKKRATLTKLAFFRF